MAAKTITKEMLVAAASGAFGGAIAKVITYPLETIKTCLANKKSDESSLDVIRGLWPVGMYKGIRLRLGKSIYSNFVFFYLMEGITRIAKSLANRLRVMRGLPRQPAGALTFLAAGFFGDALNVPIVAPVDYVLSQIQTSKTGEGTLSVIRRTWSDQGVAGFYVGWPVYVIASMRPAVKFCLIESIKTVLLRGQDLGTNLSAAQGFWLGAVTNALASSLFYPINTARIVIMSRRKRSKISPTADSDGKVSRLVSSTGDTVSNNVVDVIGAIVRKEGVGGLYKGLTSELSESTLGSAISLAVKEQVTAAVRSVVYTSGARDTMRQR